MNKETMGRRLGQSGADRTLRISRGLSTHRYKAAGTNAVDEKGNLDSTEFINVSKDDALAFPNVVHRAYPSTVVARMNSTIRPFIEKSVEVNNTLINTLNAELGLPEGTLAQLHNPEEQSRCVARVIRAPPKPGPIDEQKAMLSAHTDFGSLVSPRVPGLLTVLIAQSSSVILAQPPWWPSSARPWYGQVAVHQGS